MAPGGLLDPRVERFLMDQQYAPIREEIKREPARAAQILERFRETEPELHRLLMDNYEVIISLVEMPAAARSVSGNFWPKIITP